MDCENGTDKSFPNVAPSICVFSLVPTFTDIVSFSSSSSNESLISFDVVWIAFTRLSLQFVKLLNISVVYDELGSILVSMGCIEGGNIVVITDVLGSFRNGSTTDGTVAIPCDTDKRRNAFVTILALS